MRVLAASGNAGKLRELRSLLAPALEVVHPPADYDPPEETGSTFRENALAKARALCIETGEAALGDDSGLEVEALEGRPGIHSARYGSTDALRIGRLLDELRLVPANRRRAHFRCSLALVIPGGRELVAEGELAGFITVEPRGADGFGYDPVFYVPRLDRTLGEASAADKARISHRAAAARNLLANLARSA